MPNKFITWLMLILGLLGTVICIAVIVMTWILSSRINQATRNVFDVVDGAIVQVQDRVKLTQTRIREQPTVIESLRESLEAWTKLEAKERITSKLQIEPRAEQLASGLRQADELLELTETSLQGLSQVLKMRSTAQSEDPNPEIDNLQKDVARIREQLQEKIDFLEDLRSWAAGEDDNARPEGFTLILAALKRLPGEIDAFTDGLEKLNTRLGDLRTESQNLKATALWWVRMSAIIISLLALWMMAGQFALCSLSWRRMRSTEAISSE